MEVGRRGRRESMSPERGKMGVEAKIMRPTFKKVQVVYYLSRNGHLEHPHYMVVTHLLHQPLRLKDVLDRLIVLRGKGMPSLYSWSCKRSYKNGFVWNDLAPNDVIYPSDGAEYVLKGSELIQGTTANLEKLCHVQIESVGQHSSLLQPKRKSLASKQRLESDEMSNDRFAPGQGHGQNEEEEEEEEEYEEKTSCASSTTRSTPRSRRSRGVSTDDLEEFKLQPKVNGDTSPPSTASSTVSEKANAGGGGATKGSANAGNEPLMSRNSMLLSLIACGGSASFRKAAPPPPAEGARRSGGGPNKKVVGKAAAAMAEEDEAMIGTMSENPRFGNVQAEEKEYFSGSIVEDVAMTRVEGGHGLKKSSSHNEERSGMKGLGDAADDEEEVEKKKGVKGKCMPMKKSPYKHSKK